MNGQTFHIKGVCWGPAPKGSSQADYRRYVDGDSSMMKDAGINVVRTYGPITDRSVLDALWQKGIYIAMNVYAYGGNPVSFATDAVRAVRDHPAILMWEVGNEWNYNGLYIGMSFNNARSRVRDVVRAIKQHDSSHPVATVYGELPDSSTLSFLSDVDIWGINSYRFDDFGDLFDKWKQRSSKAMYMGEYGADAFDARYNRVNTSAQSYATSKLTNQIVWQSTRSSNSRMCSGGFVFEFNDEWWKAEGSYWNHDTGGVAPGGGPYPDRTFNEEYWGLVDIDRRKRPAFDAYKNVASP